MIDQNDSFTLSVFTYDSAGALANPTAIVCTVTPDANGTPVTPTVTTSPTGTHTAPAPTDLVGRYSVSWRATGANLGAYADSYYVESSAWRGIVSLADVKTHLNIPSTKITYDEELRPIILSATAFFERHLGPIIRQAVTQKAVVPERDGTLFLDGPVISLTSITDTYGYGSVYNVANYFPNGSTVTPLAYVSNGYRYPVTVAYVGGYTEIPGDLRAAVLDYVKWRWESQRGPGTEPGAQGPVDEFSLGTPATVPFRIMEVINGYSAPVVA